MTAGSSVTDMVPEWRELWSRAGQREPFSHPDWITAYLRCFEPTARAEVLAARSGDSLSAVLSVIRERRVYDRMPARMIRVPMNEHFFRVDVLTGGTEAGAALSALWDVIAAQRGWDVFCIPKFSHSGCVGELARVARAAGYPTLIRPGRPTRYVPLSGGGLQAETPWLSTASTDLKKKIRRARRQIVESYGEEPVLSRCECADATQLDRFYAIEASGWKRREGTAILCAAETLEFYNSIARAFAADRMLALHFLTVKGIPLAGSFSIQLDGRLFVLKWSYDEAFSKFSPGHLLTNGILRDSWERGLREVDLGPDGDYKRAWTPHTCEHASLYVFDRGRFGRSLAYYRGTMQPAVARALRRFGLLPG